MLYKKKWKYFPAMTNQWKNNPWMQIMMQSTDKPIIKLWATTLKSWPLLARNYKEKNEAAVQLSLVQNAFHHAKNSAAKLIETAILEKSELISCIISCDKSWTFYIWHLYMSVCQIILSNLSYCYWNKDRSKYISSFIHSSKTKINSREAQHKN